MFDRHVRQHSFVETGHEIISTASLSLSLLNAPSIGKLPRGLVKNSVNRLTDRARNDLKKC